MKHTLFSLFVVGLLATAPALAGHAPVTPPPTHVLNTDDFADPSGAPPIQSAPSIINDAGGFLLSINVDVFKNAAGTYTYVYDIEWNTSQVTDILSFLVFSASYNADASDPTKLANWGWVDSNILSANPFTSGTGTVSGIGNTTLFQFTLAGLANGQVKVWVQSDYAPTATPMNMSLVNGGVNFEALVTTLAPDESGEISHFRPVYVPEPSSLLLLTFGLISGGIMRFRSNRK